MIRISLCCLCVLYSFAVPCAAQQPPTSEAYLASRHVSSDLPSLRNALKNPDREVRGVAAGVLAEIGDVRSIPLLKEAIRVEQNPYVKINLSSALASLQDLQGNAALIGTCGNRNEAGPLRLTAATQVLRTGDSISCLGSVVDILRDDPSPPNRELGLQYLRRVTFAPSSLLSELREVLVASLSDPAPINRQYAGESLYIFGDCSTIRAFQRAVQVEKEEKTKDHMQDDLTRLQARLGHC